MFYSLAGPLLLANLLQMQEVERARRQSANAQIAAKARRAMECESGQRRQSHSNDRNCPNCGAPHEPVCSYCGTPSDDR
jgi:hypothetical protein